MTNVVKTMSSLRFIDIGANLTDPMFQGIYNRSQKHCPDLNDVLEKAWSSGLKYMFVTVGCAKDLPKANKLVQTDPRLFTTIGCHPTRCKEFDVNPDGYFDAMCKAIEANRSKVVAIGELGLDYDRLHFCPKDMQKKYFEKQLQLSKKYGLPLFLHCRNSNEDFMSIIDRNLDLVKSGGVVHSFDGTYEEAKAHIDRGFYIGINGCSLKTVANLETVKQLPIDKLMLETDCPWCGIRPTHAGYECITKVPSVKKEKWMKGATVNGRCEPTHISQVAEIIAHCQNISLETLTEACYTNTVNVFFNNNAFIKK